MLQAILYPTTKPLSDFKKWLHIHNYKPIKDIHVTEHYYRARITTPINGSRYYSKILPDGIIMVFQTKIIGGSIITKDDMYYE